MYAPVLTTSILSEFLHAMLRWLDLLTASFRPSFPWGGHSGQPDPDISMQAPEMTRVIHNWSHYCDSQCSEIQRIVGASVSS